MKDAVGVVAWCSPVMVCMEEGRRQGRQKNVKETVMAPGGTRGDNDRDYGGSGDNNSDEKDDGGGRGRKGEPKNTAQATARDQLQSN